MTANKALDAHPNIVVLIELVDDGGDEVQEHGREVDAQADDEIRRVGLYSGPVRTSRMVVGHVTRLSATVSGATRAGDGDSGWPMWRWRVCRWCCSSGVSGPM